MNTDCLLSKPTWFIRVAIYAPSAIFVGDTQLRDHSIQKEKKSYIVHDGVDAGELSQKYHDVGVDDGAASTRNGEEVEPSEAAGAGLCGFELVEDGVLHDEEFFPVFLELRSADALPDIESFKGAALVHEEAGRFGHEEHAHQHDGGEDERGAEHVTPAAALEWLSEV